MPVRYANCAMARHTCEPGLFLFTCFLRDSGLQFTAQKKPPGHHKRPIGFGRLGATAILPKLCAVCCIIDYCGPVIQEQSPSYDKAPTPALSRSLLLLCDIPPFQLSVPQGLFFGTTGLLLAPHFPRPPRLSNPQTQTHPP